MIWNMCNVSYFRKSKIYRCGDGRKNENVLKIRLGYLM